mmetsp:Transcript_20809/g.64746  ORF Transcript_20809/g.64746 Transcript_20809/m.64746 type:complete len:205 (+) Transcript_20809:185-799(+)
MRPQGWHAGIYRRVGVRRKGLDGRRGELVDLPAEWYTSADALWGLARRRPVQRPVAWQRAHRAGIHRIGRGHRHVQREHRRAAHRKCGGDRHVQLLCRLSRRGHWRRRDGLQPKFWQPARGDWRRDRRRWRDHRLMPSSHGTRTTYAGDAARRQSPRCALAARRAQLGGCAHEEPRPCGSQTRRAREVALMFPVFARTDGSPRL